MKLLTTNGKLACAHTGSTSCKNASQNMVFVAGEAVLIGNDPAGRAFGDGSGCVACPLANLPCGTTLIPISGQSALLWVHGTPVCLDTTAGPNQPNPGPYLVQSAGQSFVEATA